MTPEMLSLIALVAELALKYGPQFVARVQELVTKPGVTMEDFQLLFAQANELKDPVEYRNAK
jgi:hypothetical protein